MGNNEGFTYAYGWNVYYQKVLGVCPKKGEGFLAQRRAWIWAFFILTFAWIPQTASLSIIRHDLNMTIDCLSTSLSISISIVKIGVLQYHRRVIGSMLSWINKDWRKARTKEERNAMIVTARISSYNSKISFSISCLGFVAFVVSQLCVILGNGDDADRNPDLAYGFLLESYFPFNTSSPFIFAPLWLSQASSAYLSALSYAGPDCLLSTVVLHLCGQLRIVRHSLKNLANEVTTREPKKYWQMLGMIVKRHEKLNQWTNGVNKLFSSLLLGEILLCSVAFCFQGYAMFTRTIDLNGAPLPIPVLIFRLMYAVFTIEHLFVHCYVGERLFAESTSIQNDFYATPWYNLAPKEAKAFIFVCQRSAIPLELRAGKFCTFNMQLFNAIMKNSMGYLSMLMAMKERLVET